MSHRMYFSLSKIWIFFGTKNMGLTYTTTVNIREDNKIRVTVSIHNNILNTYSFKLQTFCFLGIK